MAILLILREISNITPHQCNAIHFQFPNVYLFNNFIYNEK